jgi:alkaline phosphatase
MMKKFIIVLILVSSSLSVTNAQYSTLNAHSHNDYVNEVPFWLAYNNHFGSIESDIWAIGNELLVAHSRAEIKSQNTLDSLYIQPIIKVFRRNGGKAWADSPATFQLLIDLKTAAEPTLLLLTEKIKEYPDVFDPQVNKDAVRVVITGNRPDPSDFSKYPGYIFFDGILKMKYNEQQLRRILLFSENLKNIIHWNGEAVMDEKDKIRLQSVIDSVHKFNKKVRFWNAPDGINAWNTLINMKVDYINTDHIIKLSEYLKSR